MSQKIDQLLRSSKAIITLQGREYVTFRGLLYVAHQAGLESIDVELVSWDAENRAAVCKATVKGSRGTFSDYGDADPSNVNRMIATACLRMSSTRAQGRALRSYLGVGITSVEELPGDAPKEPAPTEPPFDYEGAARWAVKVGAFSSYEEASEEVRKLQGTTEDKRRMWRKRCQGAK